MSNLLDENGKSEDEFEKHFGIFGLQRGQGVVLRAAINNGENKFREKVKERNTRFTWFDKLSMSTEERAAVIIILIIRLQ